MALTTVQFWNQQLTVYQAEQDHPRRTVALKLIKAGLSRLNLANL